jgi:ATP synthase protein I
VWRITAVQLAVLGFLFIPVHLLAGGAASLSLLAGGLCAALPQGWFAVQLFLRPGRVQHVAGRGYAAVATKFLLTAVGFALVFALLRPVVPLAVFAGFIALLLVHLGGGIWLLRRPMAGRAAQVPR